MTLQILHHIHAKRSDCKRNSVCVAIHLIQSEVLPRGVTGSLHLKGSYTERSAKGRFRIQLHRLLRVL